MFEIAGGIILAVLGLGLLYGIFWAICTAVVIWKGY